MTAPQVFVSYKHSSAELQQWVRRLVTDLIEVYGISCLLDQYDLLPGDSIYEYMQRIKTEATHVLFIITPEAITSIEQNTGGLSFEAQLWTALRSQRKIRVIPVLREGDQTASYVEAHLYIDFRSDVDYQATVEKLAKVILGRLERPTPNVRSYEQFSGLSVADKISFIQSVDLADSSARSLIRQALLESSKGVVGAALKLVANTEWREALLADFEPLRMVWIPPGSIITPSGVVAVEEYYIDRFPVTNGEFAEFVAATRRMPPHYWHGQTPPPALVEHPVVYASFYDAIDYASWVGKRLPTDLEWEKAAAWDPEANALRPYPWGDKFDEARCNNEETGCGDTAPIGTFSPAGDSFYGVAEMFGNIREWTGTLATNLPFAEPDQEGGQLERVIVMGRSWNRLTTWGRLAAAPSVGPMANSFYRFRCALTL